MSKYKSEADICKDAILVQDACNLVGVLGSFHEAALWLLREGRDTDAVCNHPAMKLFADKVAHLTGMQTDVLPQFSRAYDYCKEKTHEPATSS